ncbi:DUF3857 domain-containing protein [Paraburkholderia kururiensis]|uniref:DUF3857 domain-containing protein n=1 Tax=Paraburkholderia kururiensis TaxID=984307 RepID=UPI00138748E7|nr:DUF3857 domain-containing protein [Paraburkholderia kururiensis]
MDIARFAALAAAVLASSPALPESTYLPPYTVLSTENIYTVNLDGTYSEEVREAYRINTQDGITQLAQVPLYFSGERDELEVLSAETVTANGRTVPVPRESILLQQDAMSAHGPIYDDLKVKNVIFPALGIGAVLRLSYRYRQKTALFPGEFFMLEGFPRRDEYKSALVEINAPATLPLHVQAEGMHGGEIATGKPGLRSWRWTLMDASAAPPETGSVSDIDFSPRIIASTFADYDAVARAYWDGASAKAAVTPEIRRLAESLTAGITDRRTQAEVLYNWVSRNVRYVQVYFGSGSVIPHDAGSTADSLYGDCKDHVTLLDALLAAKGIASSPALVNQGFVWWLPKVATPTGIFNHVITYVPEWRMFVDSTAGFARFGVLPWTLQGKTALVTNDGSGKSRLIKLPIGSPEHEKLVATTHVGFASDGSLSAATEVSSQGATEVALRAAHSSYPQPDQRATALLAQMGLIGNATLAPGAFDDLSVAYRFTSTIKLPGSGAPVARTRLELPGWIGTSTNGLAGAAADFSQLTTRHFPMAVRSELIEERTIITLPRGVVARLPAPVLFDSPFGTYEARYTGGSGTVTVTRRLRTSFEDAVLPPERYAQLRQMGLAIAQNLKTQIEFEAPVTRDTLNTKSSAATIPPKNFALQ